MKNIITLMRPYQYVKNFFIFLPLFFSGNFQNTIMVFDTFIVFVGFSLVASSMYILNDYLDISDDRKHPKKRYRPLAAKTVSIRSAKVLFATLLGLGTIIISIISIKSLGIALIYIVLNIAYTIKLKHIAIIDIIIIAIGFVLRLFLGAFATGLVLSSWIVIMTFLLALFLALAKRRDDVLIFDNTGEKMRKVLDGYNIQFIDMAMTLMSGIVIVSYIMYCTSLEVIQRIHNDNLYLTSLFVIIGIMRYMQLTFVGENSGSPTKILLKDPMIQIAVILWLISFGIILY